MIGADEQIIYLVKSFIWAEQMRPAQREEAWRNKISAREGQIKKYLIKVPRDSMVFTNAASQKSIFDIAVTLEEIRVN